MPRVVLRKLLPPTALNCVQRPRLLDASGQVQLLVVQAPAGAGKTVFLTQWLAARGRPAVTYELDSSDQQAATFLAHLTAGFQRAWPGWSPPQSATQQPSELAVEIVSEAAARPPLDLVLDRVDFAFGQAYLADFLAVLLRYAPPSLTVALGTRAPLPVEVREELPGVRVVRAAELAFTAGEAAAWLEERGDWTGCLIAAGGLPLALDLWRKAGGGWADALRSRLVADPPPHVSPELVQTLVADWLDGRISLAAFADRMACVPPGTERQWAELRAVRELFLAGEFATAQNRLQSLWEDGRGRGDQKVVGAAALLWGETCYGLGEYTQALEWYRQAFAADPALEFGGTHSMPFILRDQGFLDEGLALAQRCVEACAQGGDLQALSWARLQYGHLLAEHGRFDEGEAEMSEAERVGFLCGTPLYGILALLHRASLASIRGNIAAYRSIAEKGYTLVRGRSPWVESLAAYVLAGALLRWGERETAGRLMMGALETLSRLGVKFQVHMLLTIAARARWVDSRVDEARQTFDRALHLAAAEGYVYILSEERFTPVELLTDALVRKSQVAFCQRILVQVGQRALPALLALARSADAEARQAALYPLAAIGGAEALAAVRSLLHDEAAGVREAALLALQAMAPSAAEAGAPAAAAPGVAAAAPGARPRLRVLLLGPMMVEVDGRPVQNWRTNKARDLLAFLLLGGSRPYTREQLGEALWPGGDPDGVVRLLHTSLHNLRRSLGKGAEGLIGFAGGAYRLEPDAVELDVDAVTMQRLAAAAGEASWREAVQLYRGDLLEGLDYPWCEGQRARLRSLYLETLRRLAAHLSAGQRWSEAVAFLEFVVQTDPLAEEAHVALMECHAAMGNRNAAFQQYRTLARMLDEEVGVEPGPKARELYQRLLDQ